MTSGIMEKIRDRVTTAMLYNSLAFILTIVWGVIYSNAKGADLGDTLLSTLVAGALSLTLSFFFQIKDLFFALDRRIEDVVDGRLGRQIKDLDDQARLLKDAIEKSILADLGKRVINFVNENHANAVGKLLNQWSEEINIGIDQNQKRFVITQQELALRSYKIFWDILLEEQKERRKKGEPPLNILVIHSTSWEVWTKHMGRENLLKTQREFCANHGKVTRILCKKEEEPNANIRSIASDMNKFDIKVLYYNSDSGKVIFDFCWDFLYVRETKVAVIWSSFQNDLISTSTYQIGDEFDNKNLEELWGNIEKNVEDKYKDEAKWWADESSTTVKQSMSEP